MGAATQNIVISTWPRQMPAAVAAAYCGEKNVITFRNAVGSLYPEPKKVRGKGDRWLKEDLDKAIDQLHGKAPEVTDAADEL